MKLYKVGGSVRDSIMGVEAKDIDYAVECGSYREMCDYITSRGVIFLENPQFGTVRAKLNNGEPADFSICRRDGGYSDGRRPDSIQVATLHEDLARRDFTMNAIAQDENGHLIDPFGGEADIQDKLIRTVGCARDRFKEDSLRMLRAIRFHVTRGFQLAAEIEHELQDEQLVNLLSNVSEDRIVAELELCFRFNTTDTLDILNKFNKIKNKLFKSKIWLQPTTKRRNSKG